MVVYLCVEDFTGKYLSKTFPSVAGNGAPQFLQAGLETDTSPA